MEAFPIINEEEEEDDFFLLFLVSLCPSSAIISDDDEEVGGRGSVWRDWFELTRVSDLFNSYRSRISGPNVSSVLLPTWSKRCLRASRSTSSLASLSSSSLAVKNVARSSSSSCAASLPS